MIPCSFDPDEVPRPACAMALRYGVALLAIVFALSMAWYVAARLHIGVDISDSAYYIISYTQHRNIESQPTLAGWLWASISPTQRVLANRYLGVVFLTACFALLALEAWRIGADRWIGLAIAVAFATAGSLAYYVHWLPDPSYNSMNLGFIALGWAGLFGLLHATSQRGLVRSSEIVWALVVGVAVSSDFLVKPTSAALLGPVLLISYLVVSRRHLHTRRILALALATLFGLTLPLIALAGIGETPDRVFVTLKNGFDAGIKVTTPSLNPWRPLVSYLQSVFSAPIFKQWFTWVAIIVVTAISSNALSSRLRLTPWMRLCLGTGVATGFPLLVWHTRLFAWSDQGINGLLVLVLALALQGILLAAPDRRSWLGLGLGAMLVSPVIYVFGTGNDWAYLVPTAGGFACAALGTVVAALPQPKQLLVAIPGMGLLATLLIATAIGIEWHPYRTSAPLSNLQSPARVGPFNERFLESPTQATFYNKLADIRPMVEQLPERPYLIDLSGRVPMVAFQIGAKVPRTPWLFGGYPGSLELFHFIIGKISHEDLKRAWVFQAHDHKGHFPDAILQRYELNFPADYLPITTVPVQYLGVEGTLYAPAASMKDVGLQEQKRLFETH